VHLRLSNAINKASCGASFVITLRVASGVTSRLAKPVPPVVKITFTLRTSA